MTTFTVPCNFNTVSVTLSNSQLETVRSYYNDINNNTNTTNPDPSLDYNYEPYENLIDYFDELPEINYNIKIEDFFDVYHQIHQLMN